LFHLQLYLDFVADATNYPVATERVRIDPRPEFRTLEDAMTTHAQPAGMIRAASPLGPHTGYMPGFGNDFETEALPGACRRG